MPTALLIVAAAFLALTAVVGLRLATRARTAPPAAAVPTDPEPHCALCGGPIPSASCPAAPAAGDAVVGCFVDPPPVVRRERHASAR